MLSHQAPRPAHANRPISTLRCLALLAAGLAASSLDAAQFNITGPSGSGAFGRQVAILPNGNIVVVDPLFNAPGPVMNVGAVHLYRPTGTLISSLRGSTAGDSIGSRGVFVLANGNFVVVSPLWDRDSVVDAGAVTLVNATDGINGEVSPTNSLVGTSAADSIGDFGVLPLTNGNYVVVSLHWDEGNVDVGAVTFARGTTGLTGPLSANNSLIGKISGDLADVSVTALPSGNYVVSMPRWDNSQIADAGAVTFGSGETGVAGGILALNSLVGTSTGDAVGIEALVVLANGNYVVNSPAWNNGATSDAGAVTLGSGATGVVGAVSASNSLVGTQASDRVGAGSVVPLTNGNYVVESPFWNNGTTADAGAATFGSGTLGVVGPVSPANSLVGTTAVDLQGVQAIALTNGNYVVRARVWDNGATVDAGAVIFGNGSTGITGPVTPVNALVGSTAGDQVGQRVTALANGNYVVASSRWDSGSTLDVGAVTFASGTTGRSGVVTSTNSLVGGSTGDQVGSRAVTPLANGNYVVSSPRWDNGGIVDAGAVTLGSGTLGISGPLSPITSLFGFAEGDQIGQGGVVALANGNYVVRSPLWDNGPISNAGAVTFGRGDTGNAGTVTPANSLVGGSVEDRVGDTDVRPLRNGDYLVNSQSWDRQAIFDAGALTFGSGATGVVGLVSPLNSLVGDTSGDLSGLAITEAVNGNYIVRNLLWDNAPIINAGAITLGLANGSVVGPVTSTHSVLGTVGDQGPQTVFAYDALRNQLAVGMAQPNRVVLHRTGAATSISIVGGTPNPALIGSPVSFVATLSTTSATPPDGRVTFTAGSGESCADTSATATSPSTAEYSCTIVFTTPGTTNVVAEFTGSIIHAYSGSAPVPHTSERLLFANGFEGP